jgi:5-methylthioribose kinase
MEWTIDLAYYAVRHTLACMLARVAGRSPLEYMTLEERERQRAVIVELISEEPQTVEALILGFISRISEIKE